MIIYEKVNLFITAVMNRESTGIAMKEGGYKCTHPALPEGEFIRQCNEDEIIHNVDDTHALVIPADNFWKVRQSSIWNQGWKIIGSFLLLLSFSSCIYERSNGVLGVPDIDDSTPPWWVCIIGVFLTLSWLFNSISREDREREANSRK